MVELPDTRGLICGFRLRVNGTAEALSWDCTSESDWSSEGAVWLHFSLADVRAKKWIKACPRLPDRAREILLDTDPHIRLESIDNGFAGVLGDFHFEFDNDPDRLGVMRLYIDEDVVITARLQALKVADQLRSQLRQGLTVPSTLRLVVQFVEDFAETVSTIIAGQSDLVDEVEDRILKNRFLRESGDLGSVRRLVTRLRRHLGAQRNALAHQAHLAPAWWNEEDAEALRRAIERLESLSLDLESIQERARLLQEELGSRTFEATNRNLYIVSLFTAVFLPLTLITGITGIFGMNVGGLPWLEEAGGFLWVSGLMVLTLITSLVLLYWRRFF